MHFSQTMLRSLLAGLPLHRKTPLFSWTARRLACCPLHYPSLFALSQTSGMFQLDMLDKRWCMSWFSHARSTRIPSIKNQPCRTHIIKGTRYIHISQFSETCPGLPKIPEYHPDRRRFRVWGEGLNASRGLVKSNRVRVNFNPE